MIMNCIRQAWRRWRFPESYVLLGLFLTINLGTFLFSAPVPYSGKVAVNGANFDGAAQFTFALRDANGTVHWRNGADANASIEVPVDRGHYIVLLGGQGMTSIGAGLFLDHPELYLQVRFYRADTQQWLHLQPDQRITSTPHALTAELARNALLAQLAESVKAGAITLDMLSPQVLAELNATITRSRLAPGVRQDLNRTITRNMLPADVRADLNRTITKNLLGSDVLADLNSSITLARLSPDVLAALQILPSVSTQPFARYDRSDGSAQVEVTARGHALSYRWLKDGQPINGATAPVLQIADADTDDNATYAVRITNSLGETTSQVVSLQDAIGAPGSPLEEANATEVPREGLVLWLDAEDLNADGIADNLADDTKIFNWADLSGDDRNFTQSDPNLAPVVKIVGNRQALHFAQAAYLANDANATVNNVFFALNVPAGLREVGANLLTSVYGNGLYKQSNSSVFGQGGGYSFAYPSDIRTNGVKLNSLLLFDQASVISAPRTRTNWNFSAGIELAKTWEGLFHEVLLYDRILSDAERSDVEDYLMDKWGTADLAPEPEPEDGLLAYYKFESNLPKFIADSSGNGHHVTLTTPLSSTPLTSGVDGDAINLHGDGSTYFALPAYDASLKTIALWLKPEFAIEAGAPHVALWQNSSDDRHGLVFNETSGEDSLTNETIVMWRYYHTGSNPATATSAEIPDGWFHLALSWNVAAGHYDFFVDGTQVAVAPAGNNHYELMTGQSLKFGKSVKNNQSNIFTNAYDGAIDELCLYDISLTAAEIQALHAAVENPIIRTTGEHNATIGTGFSLSLQVDNGANFFQAEGLPAGLSLNVATGEISGIAQDPGYHRVYVTASNDHGKTSGVVAIHARPAIDDDGWPVDVPDGSDIPQNGMVLWLDANDVDADGAFDAGTDHLHLANWADKAGHDHNATQATAFRQPEIRSGQLPERPGLNLLRFDGNQSLAFPTINQGKTFFWVVNRGADHLGASSFFGLNNSSDWGTTNAGKLFNNLLAGGYITGGLHHSNGTIFNWPEVWFSVALSVRTLRANDFQPSDLIGKRGNAESYFTGNIGEILVYDRALTDSEIRLVEQYLGTKWGIALNQEPEVEAEAGLIGYWNFDEGEGTVLHDLSGGDKDGELTNTTESDVWQDGILGTSVRLDGLNDSFTIPGYYGGGIKTFSLWLDPGFALESNGTAVSLFGSNGQWSILLNDFNASISGEILGIRHKSSGEMTYVTEANANLSDGWNHLALVWDGGLSRYRMYLNGTDVDVNASAQGHFPFGGTHNFYFAQNTPRYAGKIDEFRIYDRSLPSAEVLALYQYPTSDADNDGLTLTREWNLGTDEDDDDSDDDGYSDGLEVSLGTDPLDPTSKSATPAQDIGLVLHWKLDEANGTVIAADSSNYSNGGALDGFAESPWVSGRIGGAMRFDNNASQLLVVQPTVSLNLPIDHSFAVWARADEAKAAGAHFNVISKTVSYSFQLRPGNQLFHWVNQPPHGWYGNGSFLSDGGWHHYVSVAVDGKAFRLYRDGEFLVETPGSFQAPPVTLHASYFGGEAALDLDDLRIYDRALSATEVQALYDATSPIPESVEGLALWLDATDIDGDGEEDTLANGAAVSLWADKSGNDRDANQSDPNAAFTYRAGTAETMPGLVLDGSNDYMQITEANMQAEYIFAVASMDQNSSLWAPIIARDNRLLLRRHDIQERLQIGVNNHNFSAPDGDTMVDGQLTNNFPYDELHVVAVGKGSGTEFDGFYTDVVLGEDTTHNRHWKGEIAEILIYNRALSTEEIDRIQAYLGEKWGVTIDSQ
jgi:hypothetical protein